MIERWNGMAEQNTELRDILHDIIYRGAENVGPLLISRAEKALEAMENMNMDTVSVPRWRKKPVEIDAWQWDGKATYKDRPSWLNIAGVIADHQEETLQIRTLEGIMTASKGDWIIRGVKGEVYPCKPDIFAATYEPASTSPASPVVGEDAPLDKAIARLTYMLQQGDATMRSKNWSGGNFNANDVRTLIDEIASLRALASIIPTPTAGRAEALEEPTHEAVCMALDSLPRSSSPFDYVRAGFEMARRALSSAPTQAVTVDDAAVEEAIAEAWQNLMDKDDRNCTDPDYCLITGKELEGYMRAALTAAFPLRREE